MQTIRPADGTETIGAYLAHLREANKGPTTIVLSRGAVNPLHTSSTDGVLKGAYILSDPEGSNPEVIISGSGTEVQLLVDAKKILTETHGIRCRI
ncbi:transferase, partial [Perkinsus sp. BL_2016]